MSNTPETTRMQSATHCGRGHDLTLPNAVYTSKASPERRCRQCRAMARRASVAARQSKHLKRAAQGIVNPGPQIPVAATIQPVYPPPSMKSWPLTSCNELPRGLTPYRPRNA